MLSRRHFLASSTATLALSGAGFAAQPVNVVATIGMIGDLVSRVGGADVDVKTLMGPGVDPHAYRQTRSDIVALTRADQIFWHGLYLEAQMEDLFADLARRTPVTAVAETLSKDGLIAHADYGGRFDPHVWMDPKLWADCATPVVEALSARMPDAAERFAQNAETFRKDAQALDVYAREMLMQVPEEARILVTAHDAFGYFGKAYGYEVLGIQGISTNSEAGLNRIAELVDLIVDRKLAAVFVETSVSDRNIRALIEGAAAKGHDLRIGGSLYSDAMGQPGTYEGTWLGMIDHNVSTIAAALGAEVPAGGRLGQLGS